MLSVIRATERILEMEAAEVSRELHLTDPIPKLCTLVTANPFDAAVHDAFGKIRGRCASRTHLASNILAHR
jgi:hypothetical protein